MGISEAIRRQRLLDLVSTMMERREKPVSTAALGALAMRSWALTRRTSQDYIDDLIAMGWARLHADGTITGTELGERAVLDLPPPPITTKPKAPTVQPSELPLPEHKQEASAPPPEP